MPGSADLSLSIEAFRDQYCGVKPYYEYWHGVPVQKSMPTWLHSLLQHLIANSLTEAGYNAGTELELRIDPDWCPIPDVVGATEIEQPYPTKAVEIVVEVLSPEDKLTQTLQKCTEYGRVGVHSIFVLDPLMHKGWRWNTERDSLDSISDMVLPNSAVIHLGSVWLELEKLVARGKGSKQ